MEQNITPQPKKAFYNLSPFILILGIISSMILVLDKTYISGLKNYSMLGLWLSLCLLLIWMTKTVSRGIIIPRARFYFNLIGWGGGLFSLYLLVNFSPLIIPSKNMLAAKLFLLAIPLLIIDLFLIIVMTVIYEIIRLIINKKNSILTQ